MSNLPAGTVTFLFTDIEGSTRLLHELGDAYADALAEHRRVLREAFARRGGVEVDTQGDAFFVAFARASDALAAAREATEALDGPIRVRIGLHTGEPLLTEEGYVGIDVHRAARIAAAGHGGQILVSHSTRELIGTNGLRDLGEHRLKDLTAPERIYQLGDGDFPPLKSLNQTNLPIQQTPLVGREQELAEVIEFVRSHRLVTLTGAGGSGKTRLALQAAADLVDEFADGVWFVSLAALSDASLVEPTIASVVGAKEDLADFLGSKRMLLVLDNLEQLLPDAAAIVSRVPVNVIATSRERLNVYGEQEYHVPTLPLEEAVALFTERARLLKPAFEPDDHVSAIAKRLDGLPLALELAAARIKVLTTEQISRRLGHGLDLLTAGSRDVPERHRTLRATIEWSYGLLSEEEQRLFPRLGVFNGTFDLEAAELVADASVDTLASLIDKSLLRQTTDGRFFMLETIREYAVDLSREDDGIHLRHAMHFLHVAGTAHRTAEAGATAEGLRALGSERENIRAALAYLEKSGRIEELFRLLRTSAFYWLMGGAPREGDAWFTAALRHGDQASLSVRAPVLVFAASLANERGDLDRALQLIQEGVDASRRLDDPAALGRAYHHLGEILLGRGERQQAVEALEVAVEAFRSAGDLGASSIVNLSNVALADARYDDAIAYAERAIEMFQRDPADYAALVARHNRAVAFLHLGRRTDACCDLRSVVGEAWRAGFLDLLAGSLVAAAAVSMDADDFSSTALLIRTAEKMTRDSGAVFSPSERVLYETVEERLDTVLPAWRNSEHFDVADAVVLALECLD